MLKGKNAVITGSTSGIGKGIAEALAKQGCNVMLNGFGDAKEIEVLRAAFEKDYKIKAAYSPADLSKAEGCESLIHQAQKELGGVDILINNAGIQHVSPVENFPTEKWDAVIAINLSSAFHTTRVAIPGMKQKGWGRIINIASAHGLVASANKSAYVAAKHGIVGFTKVVALEAANDGITCNAICPGWVLTPLVEKQIQAKAKEGNIAEAEARKNLLAEKQPMHDFTTVDQIGELAAFLCSDNAKTITGTHLSIDGGWTAQ